MALVLDAPLRVLDTDIVLPGRAVSALGLPAPREASSAELSSRSHFPGVGAEAQGGVCGRRRPFPLGVPPCPRL